MSDEIHKKVLASIPQAANYQLDTKVTTQASITPIEAKDLDLNAFPKRGSSLEEITGLAYTFDGYAQFGMEDCAALANAALSKFYHEQLLPEGLVEVRACLFFEARRWNLYQDLPDTKASIYIFSLIDKLKEHVKSLQADAL